MTTNQFGVEIVVYRDEKHENTYARIKFIFEAKTIEQAIVMAVDMLKTDDICKYYTVIKVKNHSEV